MQKCQTACPRSKSTPLGFEDAGRLAACTPQKTKFERRATQAEIADRQDDDRSKCQPTRPLPASVAWMGSTREAAPRRQRIDESKKKGAPDAQRKRQTDDAGGAKDRQLANTLRTAPL
eukprot:GHVT01037111.1.p1 GENE.GHVT01037111.1~~GHVT01037111.1.p1  ORF type:complete len:118 (-),score=22.40 GHVT01037111.1:145-498(-)